MIKVQGMALYGPLAASTRYRLGQYVPGLASLGIDLQIFHLLGNDYLQRRFSNGALPVAAMLRGGVARLADLWRQRDFDLAMVQCELFPLIPGWLERALMRQPYIYDFDDAFYLKYRSGRLGMARAVLGNKFDTFMAGSAAVTAGNQVLAKYASLHNASTHYLPTVVDTGRYLPEPARQNAVFTVGWIGSPLTATYLPELVQPLATLGAEAPLRVVVIGGKAPAIPNVEVVELPWQENTEVELINTFDVGIMPLPDDDWARGKCAFKLIQYMACGVPVVASQVGANVDVVDADCGLLASTPESWVQALRELRDDSGLRRRMGEAGRERVVEHYSLHATLPVLADVIHKVAETG